jgi:hypothetical protein
MFSVITNIYNKKTKEPTLMELFTATGKLKKFFLTIRDVKKKAFYFFLGCKKFIKIRTFFFLFLNSFDL